MDIKVIMQEKGVIPSELARRMERSATSIGQVINGGNPTVEMLQRMAEKLGCHRFEFFLDEIKAAGLMLVPIPEEEPQPQEKAEAAAEDTSDSNNEKCGGAAPKEGAEQGAASTGAAPEAPNQRAEEVRAVRFQYGCPHCGHQIQVCISEV